MRYIALILLCLLKALPAYADSPVRLIRVACIPERSLLLVSSNLLYNIQSISDEKLLQYGLLRPDHFDYTCELSKDIHYRIHGEMSPLQAKGMCGGDPRIKLSMEKNGSTAFKDIYFSPSCFSDLSGELYPYMDSILVDGEVGHSHDYYEGAIRNTFMDEKGKYSRSQEINSSDIKGSVLNQQGVDCLVKHDFLLGKKRESITACFKPAADQ